MTTYKFSVIVEDKEWPADKQTMLSIIEDALAMPALFYKFEVSVRLDWIRAQNGHNEEIDCSQVIDGDGWIWCK